LRVVTKFDRRENYFREVPALRKALGFCDGKAHNFASGYGREGRMKRLIRLVLRRAARPLLLGASVLLAANTPALAQASNPAVAAFNSCALLYNAGKVDEAIAACNQAIALDPGKADAYFIKGSALFGNGKVGSDGKYEVPPGAVEALNKYLELAPDGGHAPDVHAMLDSLK
jgi:tetratricopeptide (TPR) repeat protein